MRTRRVSSIAYLILIATGLCAGAAAQGEKKVEPVEYVKDAYTGGEEAAMKRAGYVSLGPFQWDDKFTTKQVRRMLPTLQLLFVETAHFKIGSALPSIPAAKLPKRRRARQAELKALKQRLPRVNPRTRVLDRWLRLHMFAQRLENHYAEFSKLLGVTDADFPEKAVRLSETKLRGEGPYLGVRGKYLFLLLTRASDLGRYTATATGSRQPLDSAHAHYFLERGSLYTGTHTELMDHRLADDHAMHCHVLYCASLSFVRGYKGYRYKLPQWIPEGIAHWFSHKFDPKDHSYRPMKEGMPITQFDERWAKHVRGLVKNSAYRPLSEIMQAERVVDLDFLDHMAAWSRIDFMLGTKPAAYAAFMNAAKDPIDPDSGEVPPFDRVVAQVQAALKGAWGCDAPGFDDAWTRFVLETYPRR